MTKVIGLMSMSLDGYVADANDGVAEVFDWYFSGEVEVPTASGSSGMTFRVSEPSADHLRGLVAEVGAMLTGRRTFERAERHPRNAGAGYHQQRNANRRKNSNGCVHIDHRFKRRAGTAGDRTGRPKSPASRPCCGDVSSDESTDTPATPQNPRRRPRTRPQIALALGFQSKI